MTAHIDKQCLVAFITIKTKHLIFDIETLNKITAFKMINSMNNVNITQLFGICNSSSIFWNKNYCLKNDTYESDPEESIEK